MSEPHPPPIFYDPRHRRWRRFTRTVQSIAAVGSCIVAVLLASVLINPVLPSLGLPPIRALPHVHHLAPPCLNVFPVVPSEDFSGPSGSSPRPSRSSLKIWQKHGSRSPLPRRPHRTAHL